MSDYNQAAARRAYLNIGDEIVNLTDEILSIEDEDARLYAKAHLEEACESLLLLKNLLNL